MFAVVEREHVEEQQSLYFSFVIIYLNPVDIFKEEDVEHEHFFQNIFFVDVFL